MPHYGLTGGIGSGKSTVAAMFSDKGAFIIDADAISRELMEPGEETLQRVVAAFGEEILLDNGQLNRPHLASLIFANPAEREKLNAIVHPAVRERSQLLREEAVAQQGENATIIEDIPLLTETGQADRFDGVIVVCANEMVRLERLTTQRGILKEDALARIKAQASDEERAQIARWIIDNSGSREDTQHQVERVWQEIIQPAS
ncbi:dephospho-CoA kinase [Rothia amarae]|uniref:Dephospho-CoA kinase n=1 Tax=Rothia amarae TaxID=169480 RepID=A0A7H2BHF0_9MICC|nr:dephospho-CoA kinase [Rothia amarae]QNV39096.1 dephospho-CoA kinase [Rothia amarae]